MNAWIQLGIVGKAHGLNGAFFISQRDEALPPQLKNVSIGPDPERAPSFLVDFCRMQSDRPLLQCQSLRSREAAESLLLQPIWCRREAIAIDEGAEYLWGDLIGKEVLDINGARLGKILEIGNFGASDLVRIVEQSEGQKPRYLELPFVASYFDMSFRSSDRVLRLVVNKDLFDDIWT